MYSCYLKNSLPDEYYSNEKNGITNKHRTENSTYTTISVEPLEIANPAYLIETGYNIEIQNTNTDNSNRVTKREKVKLTAQQWKEKLTVGLSNL